MSTTRDFDRRRFCGVAAATLAAGPLGLFGVSRRVNAMTQALTDVAQPTGSDGTDIRPFRFKASEAELTDLRRRIDWTKWPEREWGPDSSQGLPLRTMQNLALYWGTAYDWKKCEARLSALPQFTTEIDRLHALRGVGRRLGECRVGGDGDAASLWAARHLHQHVGHRASRDREGYGQRRGANDFSVSGRTARVGPARLLL